MLDIEEEERYGYLDTQRQHDRSCGNDSEAQILSIIKRHRPIYIIVPRQEGSRSVGEEELELGGQSFIKLEYFDRY